MSRPLINGGSMKKTILIIFSLLFVTAFFVDRPLSSTFLASVIIASFICILLKKSRMSTGTMITVAWGIIAGNVFLFVYNSFQNFIPFWDYAGYYVESLRGASDYYSGITSFFKQIYDSMQSSDYTKLPVLFTAPLIHRFGGGYGTYLIIIYNVFLVPFFIVISNVIQKINKSALVLIFLFPPFLNPLLRGFLDSVGLLYIAVWIYVIYSDNLDKINVKQSIILGLLTTVFVFTRRWFLFYAVGAFAAVFLVSALRLLWDKKYNFKNMLLNLLITGGTTLFIVLVFFFPYFKRLIGNNLSDTYSAYMFGGFLWNINYFLRYYGYICFAFVILSIFAVVRKKTRYFTLFLIIQSVIMFLLFVRIQTISYHHHYLFATNVLLLIILGVRSVPKFKKFLTGTVIVFFVFNCIYSYVPFKPDLAPYMTSKRFAPKTADTEKIISLCDALNKMNAEDQGPVYILASSEILNDDMLRNCKLPKIQNALNNHFGTAHVDKRDGFPNNLLLAKYIVVADPVQVHLGEENQQIIAYFVKEILSGENTPNLTEVYSESLADDVNIRIFRRDAGYTLDFLNKTKAHFESIYPDYPALYDVDFVYSQY